MAKSPNHFTVLIQLHAGEGSLGDDLRRCGENCLLTIHSSLILDTLGDDTGDISSKVAQCGNQIIVSKDSLPLLINVISALVSLIAGVRVIDTDMEYIPFLGNMRQDVLGFKVPLLTIQEVIIR